MLYVNIIMLHVDMIMLHIVIIYPCHHDIKGFMVAYFCPLTQDKLYQHAACMYLYVIGGEWRYKLWKLTWTRRGKWCTFLELNNRYIQVKLISCYTYDFHISKMCLIFRMMIIHTLNWWHHRWFSRDLSLRYMYIDISLFLLLLL